MAELSGIGYTPGGSPLHRLDPRTKQIMLLLLGMAALQAGPLFLAVASLVVLALLLSLRLGIIRLLRDIRYLLLFLLFVVAVQAIRLEDGLRPAISTEGLTEALLLCWRLLTVVLMGLLFIATTRAGDIRANLIWLLRPLPFVNAQATATMIGLLVRFLPLILHEAGEIGDAMRARASQRRRNPLPRLIRFTVTLFRNVFRRADELVDGMQARCYNEDRTLPALTFTRRDAAAAAVGMLLLALAPL